MKGKIVLAATLVILFSVSLTTSFGQSLSRQEYRVQLQQALDRQNTVRVEGLLTSQRGEAFRFIEALLDSAVIKKASGEVSVGQEDWSAAKELADAYARLFSDSYYVERAIRSAELASEDLEAKADMLAIKKEAQTHFLKGDYPGALESYQQALETAKQIGDIDEAATLIGNVGAVQFYLGDFDLALQYYQESLAQLQTLGDKRRTGNRLTNIASVYNDQSDYPKALEFYDRAVAIHRELNDQRGLAADFNNIGSVYQEMGVYHKALRQYQAALQINRDIDNPRSVGKNLANIANIHINLGDYLEARTIYEQALAIRRAQEDWKGEANDLGNLGEVYESLGDYETAMTLFQEAFEIHREIGFREGEAYQLGRMAEAYRLRGEYAKAIVAYQDARDIHKEMGHTRGEAIWLGELGQTYRAVGDLERASEALLAALQLHRDIGSRGGEAAALAKLGLHHLELEEIAGAEDYFQQALQIHEELGEKSGECVTLANLAYVYAARSDSAACVANLVRAFELAEELADSRLQAWIQLQLGDFYRSTGVAQKAENAYEQGLTLSERLIDPELRWRFYYGRGRLSEQETNPERAVDAYAVAIAIIEDLRGKTVGGEMKANILHDRFDAYEAMILLLIKLGQVEEAFDYVERARSRSLLDGLGNVKITDHDSDSQLVEQERILRAKIDKLLSQLAQEGEQGSQMVRGAASEIYRGTLDQAQREYRRLLLDLKLRHPKYADMVTVAPASASQIREWLDAETALLEYFIVPDALFIFVVTADRVGVVRVNEGREELRGRITLFRGLAAEPLDETALKETFWAAPLHKLYQVLIGSVEIVGYLRDKKQLVIVPQGFLHYLPFQALVTQTEGQGGSSRPRFLVEDYTVSNLPSASSLKFFQKGQKADLGSLMLLAPQTTTLPSSVEEVAAIANLFGSKAQSYLSAQATETLVKSQAAKYDLLHFATTAHFNKPNPLFSHMDLAKSENDDGQLAVHEILGLDLDASLITLSGCQTALAGGYGGTFPLGDDLVSVTRAFLYAGSSRVVASLWEVSDVSTSLFMQAFYKYLDHVSTGQALALAQRDMIAGRLENETFDSPSRYAHPYFWAPFILVGDWR